MNKCYDLNTGELNEIIEKLSEKYIIYAPKRVHNGGRYALDDTVIYGEISSFEDIEFEKRTIFSMKEVLTPLTQTLFYFTEDEFREAKLRDNRELLILGHACDLNSVKIQDQIFKENGGYEDYFYSRLRDKAHFVLMECTTQYDGCFCCSLGTNVTDLHDFAISPKEDGAYIQLNNNIFSEYLENYNQSNYEIEFVKENKLVVDYPHINNKEEYIKLKEHPMWDEYDKRCIACGKCTIACNTCTCFTTTDFYYTENAHVGERRRTCTSCMLESFDEVAGGENFRKSIKDRYRFKILHKVYNHDDRFHTGPMCVGCGLCDNDCPQLISYSETLNKINKALKEIRVDMEEEETKNV